ncbi:2827_t:CDS:2 [Scutellospora calospora]|uniref:2827_t:CDS:1 n=1 Tax=Scutellospora calospora TaxID=85575 RepID=A0ACA9K2M5_9GLOM|nr:2827_t:CDS:2 [Scutellospora calospora]
MATDTANLFHKKHTPKKGTKTSGVYLFGLYLKILDEVRKSKRYLNALKQVDQCSNSNLTKRAVNIEKLMLTEFNEKISEVYNSDDILILESLSYSVKKHNYEINYGDNDKIKKKQKAELIAKTFNKQNISRNSYRDLCDIEFHLPLEKQNVERQVKHIMIMIAILDNKDTIQQPNYHYTIVLYSGSEDYEILMNITASFCDEEMSRIKVSFKFWQNHESKDWDYISLMGDDKLKILQFFDLSTIFSKSHASIIRELWNKFYELYRMIKNPNTKGDDFQYHAKKWLALFLLLSEGIPNT